MFDVWGMNDIGAERCTNALMSEADPQYGNVNFSYKPSVEAKVRFALRCAGSW
jgi:hypothetical protein